MAMSKITIWFNRLNAGDRMMVTGYVLIWVIPTFISFSSVFIYSIFVLHHINWAVSAAVDMPIIIVLFTIQAWFVKRLVASLVRSWESWKEEMEMENDDA